jgi:hypothetical protein
MISFRSLRVVDTLDGVTEVFVCHSAERELEKMSRDQLPALKRIVFIRLN